MFGKFSVGDVVKVLLLGKSLSIKEIVIFDGNLDIVEVG